MVRQSGMSEEAEVELLVVLGMAVLTRTILWLCSLLDDMSRICDPEPSFLDEFPLQLLFSQIHLHSRTHRLDPLLHAG